MMTIQLVATIKNIKAIFCKVCHNFKNQYSFIDIKIDYQVTEVENQKVEDQFEWVFYI